MIGIGLILVGAGGVLILVGRGLVQIGKRLVEVRGGLIGSGGSPPPGPFSTAASSGVRSLPFPRARSLLDI